MKRTLSIILIIFILTVFLTSCSVWGLEPTKIRFATDLSGAERRRLEEIIDNFNNTIGYDLSIQVEHNAVNRGLYV